MYIEPIVELLITNYSYQSWLKCSIDSMRRTKKGFSLLTRLSQDSVDFVHGTILDNVVFDKERSILKDNHKDYDRTIDYVHRFSDSDIKTYLKKMNNHDMDNGVTYVWTKLYKETDNHDSSVVPRGNFMHKLDLVEYIILNDLKAKGNNLAILKLQDSSIKHLDYSCFYLKEHVIQFDELLSDYYIHRITDDEVRPSCYLEMKKGRIKKKRHLLSFSSKCTFSL